MIDIVIASCVKNRCAIYGWNKRIWGHQTGSTSPHPVRYGAEHDVPLLTGHVGAHFTKTLQSPFPC